MKWTVVVFIFFVVLHESLSMIKPLRIMPIRLRAVTRMHRSHQVLSEIDCKSHVIELADNVRIKPTFHSDHMLLTSANIEVGLNKTYLWDGKRLKPAATLSRMDSNFRHRLNSFLREHFVPSGDLKDEYFTFTTWRLVQRLISSTCSVFGAQALLLALGGKKKQIGAAAAAMWVIKDALGKLSRIAWASKLGRRFDSDCKMWRFRSSLLYVLGSYLEMFTYFFPSLFLLTAAVANALKQIAILTYSATRNSIYKSFSLSSDNIGDVTAKGESQLAVVDLLGLGLGVLVTRYWSHSAPRIVLLYAVLSGIELLCTFNEIKSVVFSKLNFQRSNQILSYLLTIPSFSHQRDPRVDLDHSTLSAAEAENENENEDLDEVLCKVLDPKSVAATELVCGLSGFAGEGLYVGWDGLPTTSPEKIAQCANIAFHANKNEVNMQKKMKETSVPFPSPLFVVIPTLFRPRSLAEFVRCCFDSACGRTILRSLPTTDAEGRGGGGSSGTGGGVVGLEVKVVLSPKANQKDIFESQVVVHKLKQQFLSNSVPVSWSCSVKNLLWMMSSKRNGIEISANNLGNSNSSTITEPISDKDIEDQVMKWLKVSFAFKASRMSDILALLKRAGWDDKHFMFGPIPNRGEIQ